MAGLTAIKACLEEDATVVCYELSDNVGGLWHFRDEDVTVEATNTVHQSTCMNSSKEISALSDYPMPDHFPNFLRHQLVIQYLQSYAAHFDLTRHIRFRHKVVKVTQDEEDRKWSVESLDLERGKVVRQTFDAVAMCTGLLRVPKWPDIPRLETFVGEQLHSVSYRSADKFKGKRVLVVGIGNSAADIASDLSTVASKVYLSARHGTWVMNRAGPGGLPNDVMMFKRFMLYFLKWIPRRWGSFYAEWKLNNVLDHRLYGIKPDHHALDRSFLINDDFGHKLLTGAITLKKDLAEVFEDGVRFAGETEKTTVDVIIFSTGFQPAAPEMDNCPHEAFWTENSANLYQYVFPPDFGHGTMGFIGYMAAFGPVFPAFEMQSRWFAAVAVGRLSLPSREEMRTRVSDMARINRERFVAGKGLHWFIDYMPYMDSLAETLGVRPNLKLMLFKDPVLFWHCVFGTFTAYQFRLGGPHAWSGARDAIINCFRRILTPFRLLKVGT